MCSIAGLTVCVVGSIIFAETNEDRFKERGAGKAVSQSVSQSVGSFKFPPGSGSKSFLPSFCYTH